MTISTTTLRVGISSLALSLFALFLLTLQSSAKPPQLSGLEETDENTDFGYAPQYSKLSRVYWIKASGQDTIRIHNVKPGCGCTEIPIDKDIIPPGDSARLELIFDTKRSRGAVSKKPQIQIYGELFPRVLKFYAYIISDRDKMEPISVSPRTFDLPPGQTAEVLTLSIKNGADEEIFLSLVHPQKEFMTVDLPEKIAAGATASALIHILPSAQKKAFENSITFEAKYGDGRKVSRHSTPIRYQVIPDSTISDSLP